MYSRLYKQRGLKGIETFRSSLTQSRKLYKIFQRGYKTEIFYVTFFKFIMEF